MSLISCITNYGMAILVGDLAISDHERDGEIYIPTLNKQTHENDFAEGKRRIVSFQIKTFIIKEKLAVGVSGNVETISGMIKYLKDFFLYRDVNRDTLHEFYLAFDMQKNYADASAIFLLRVDMSTYYLQVQKFGNWIEKRHPYVDHIFSSGSGSEEWTNKLIESVSILNLGNKVITRATIDTVLLNSIYFIEEDRVGPENFQNGWGLPIDITCYDGTFFKLERVCYITWYVDVSAENWRVMPQTIIKVTNLNEKIFIHNYNGQLRLYGVRTLDSKEVENWPDRLDFSSNIVCSCVLIFQHGELQSKLYSVYHDHEKNDDIIFAEFHEGRLAFAFSQELTAHLEQSVRDFI